MSPNPYGFFGSFDPSSSEENQDPINQLKKRLGFSEEPVLDNQGYWTIGYGERLNDKPGGPQPYATISEPMADEALRYRFQQNPSHFQNDNYLAANQNAAGASPPTQTATSASPSEPYGPNLDDAETGRRARVIFGETSGVWPTLKDADGRMHDPNNWDPASVDELNRARAYIGVVSSRNPIVHSADPDLSKSLDRQQWNGALQAAINSRSMDQTLDPNIGRFYIRQEDSAQKVPTYSTLTPPIGPFNNVGGGDVPRGNRTFFDFYRK